MQRGTPKHRRRLVRRLGVGLVLLIATILLFTEARRRQGLYWYEVDDDYRFEFAERHLARMTVPVSREGIVLPETDADWDTALLAIRVSSTLSGQWFEPSISMYSEAYGEHHQFFERGARGIRYLTLPDTLRAGEPITLQGHHLSWDPQSGELLLLRHPRMSGRKTLVLAPHPDDAEIAAFGFYADHDTHVATVSAGNYVDGLYQQIVEDPAEQDRLRGEVRTWDSLVVPLWGGVSVERTVNFGFLTGTLEALHLAEVSPISPIPPGSDLPPPFRRGNVHRLLAGRAGESSWSGLVQDIETLLATVRPEIVVAPHPALDAAADHRFTTLALLEALERLDDRKVILLLYTNHHVWTEYFPFGPSSSLVTLPPWFDTEAPFASVYFHPLDEKRQIQKLFALGAMHDLRAPPRTIAGGPAGRLGRHLRALFSQLRRDPIGSYSYFRRAVRPNELFFVYLPDDRPALVAYTAATARDTGGPGY